MADEPLDDARFQTDQFEQFVQHYDPSRIYVRASDDRGHATVLRVPLPHHVAGMIRSFVGDSRTPHRSMNDAVRDALYHWAYWWAEELKKSPDKAPVMHPSILLADMDRIRERDAFIDQTLESARAWYRSGVDPLDWDRFTETMQFLDGMVNTTQRREYERLAEEVERDRTR